jgi:hypothetical protein
MTYPYDASTLAALSRLASYYNGNPYNAGSNPGGMGAGGHRTNFVPSLQDLTLVGNSVEDAADAASTSATSASSSATSAAAQAAGLTATSTTSLGLTTGAKAFITQSGKGFNVGTWMQVTSDASPTTHYMIGQVTAYSGTNLSIQVTQLGTGTGTRADWTILGRTGSPGPTGPSGNPGAQGTTVALSWLFNTAITDTDTGNGLIHFNSATLSAVTTIYFDNLDSNGASQTTWLDALDDSTQTTLRGTLYLMQLDDPDTYAVYNVTGTVVDGTGYRKVPVTYVMANNVFVGGHQIGAIFTRTGDKGTDGAGAGDTLSDIAVVTDGRLVKYNGTTGKHITDAGFIIGTSGTAIGALSTANTWAGSQTFNGSLIGGAAFSLTGVITPSAIASQQNDYAPAGIATATVLRLSATGTQNISGITTGTTGRVLSLVNVGSSDIVLLNNSTSTAANQFSLGADYTIAPGQGVGLIYDGTSSRWRPSQGLIGVASSGLVTRPSYSFMNDPNTGIYNVSADVLGFAVGGVNVHQISSTQFDVNIATDAASTTSAAVVIDGGLGVAKKAFFGETITATGIINANGGINIGGAFGIATINLTGGQIQFPATQAPSANVNTLDDYEEGTFTPTIKFGTSSTGITYTSQDGTYTKIGRVVHFIIRLVTTSLGTATGNMFLAGLPFAPSVTPTQIIPCPVWSDGLALPMPITCNALPGNTDLSMYGTEGTAHFVINTTLWGTRPSAVTLYVQGTYFV